MADPTNAKIRNGVQKPFNSIDGNELIELDDLSINTGDPNFYISSLNVLSDWVNHRWLRQSAPCGFVPNSIGSITFNDSTRKLTITPQVTCIEFYSAGKFFCHTTADEITITANEGLHWIFYNDEGNLVDNVNPDFQNGLEYLRYYAIVAYVYWDATNSEAIYFTERNELHEWNMSGATHAYLHYTQGTKFLNGCNLTDVQSDQSGNEDSHAQFGLYWGYIKDEDIKLVLSPELSTTGLPIFYLDGSSGNLRRQFNSGFSVLTAGTGRLAWNQWTGSTWQLTELANNKFVNYFVVGYNDGDYGYCSFVGQTEYNSKKDAQDAAINEAFTIITGNFNIAEALMCHVITFQTSDSYGNAVKGRVVGNPLNLTRSNLNLIASLNLNHNTLINLELAAPTGVTWGHIDDVLYSLFVNPDQTHIYYVSNAGNDANSGLNIEQALADFQVAILKAQALTPSPTNKFIIVCLDAGYYSSPTNLYSWISIYAPNVRFRGGTIGISGNCSLVFDHFDNEGDIGRVLYKLGPGNSSLRCRRIDGRIEVGEDILYVTTDELIAPLTTDEYIDIIAAATLYIRAHKIKSKITVENTGTLYINVDNSIEITENFINGSIIHKFYLDRRNEEQIYYFGKHGDNSHSGLTIDDAVADPQTAQNLAVAQTPSATNRFTLVCLDAGIYTPPVALNSWISIYAPNAKFFDGAMEVKDNVNIVIDHYDNNGTIGNYIWKSGTGTSSIKIRQVNAKIEITQGFLYVNIDELIAPSTSDQYLHVLGNTTMHLNAMKIKGEMRIETNGNAYLNIDDTSEFTENFWTTVNVYRNYKDQVNPSINLTAGNFILQPYYEHTRFSNDGATGEVTYQLSPITSAMITRGTIYFEVDSDTQYLNIVTSTGATIRVGDATNTKLRSKSIGNIVGLFVRTANQWTVETMVGNWELMSKT